MYPYFLNSCNLNKVIDVYDEYIYRVNIDLSNRENGFELYTNTYDTSRSSSQNDYYPGGMGMPERTFNSESYHCGFNGTNEDNIPVSFEYKQCSGRKKNLYRMTKIYLLIVFLISDIFFVSCKRNDFDAESAARQYCECMTDNSKKVDILQSSVICDAELTKENRFFRINYIEDKYGRYMTFLSKSTTDSIADFNLRFINYVEKELL